MKAYLLAACLLMSMTLLGAVEKNTNVLILDTSKSMRGTIDGQRKVDLLKAALPDFIKLWPQGEKLAVLTYGRHSGGTCQRIRTLNPAKPLDKVLLNEEISKLKAGGDSPMISALYQAERQLRNRQGHIILISAGSDSCRKLSSCNVAKKMKKNHPNLFIHTVDMQGNNSTLQCIAKATGGEYYSIKDIQQLTTALFSDAINNDVQLASQHNNDTDKGVGVGTLVLQSIEQEGGAVVPASYVIYSDEGKHVATYSGQKQIKQILPTGQYTITSIYNLLQQDVTIEVNANQTIDYDFVLQKSGTLNLSSSYKGQPISTLYTVYNQEGTEMISTISSDILSQRLPIGEYRVEAQYDGDKQTIRTVVEKDSKNNVLVKF